MCLSLKTFLRFVSVPISGTSDMKWSVYWPLGELYVLAKPVFCRQLPRSSWIQVYKRPTSRAQHGRLGKAHGMVSDPHCSEWLCIEFHSGSENDTHKIIQTPPVLNQYHQNRLNIGTGMTTCLSLSQVLENSQKSKTMPLFIRSILQTIFLMC